MTFFEAVLGFMVETAIANSVAIFLAAGLVAFVAGPFLKTAGIGDAGRMTFYSMGGVAAGVCSYMAFDAAGRPVEAWEVAVVAVGMSVYCALVIGVAACAVTAWRILSMVRIWLNT